MSIELRHSRLDAGDCTLHVVEAGDPHGRPYLFLHGWPESWRTWKDVLILAGSEARAIAIDLPGIGGSTGPTDGSKRQLAATVHELVSTLELSDLTLVGHDIGGMVTYAYLREYADIARAVIMDTAVPGVEPWSQVLANPYIWHFGFHAVRGLPETLVRDNQAEYFGYFYDVLSAEPDRITAEARGDQVDAYRTDAAMSAGFDFYRAFTQDAQDNAESSQAAPIHTPLLYLRAERGGGDVEAYSDGFTAAGITHLRTAVVPDTGHFMQEETPTETWRVISGFADS